MCTLETKLPTEIAKAVVLLLIVIPREEVKMDMLWSINWNFEIVKQKIDPHPSYFFVSSKNIIDKNTK